MTGRLILRTAPESVLLEFLRRFSGDATLLTSTDPPATFIGEVLRVPPGAFRWELFDAQLKRRLAAAPWEEIIVLDNGGGGYLPVFLTAWHISPRARVRLFRGDGGFREFRSASELVVRATFRAVAGAAAAFALLPAYFAALGIYRFARETGKKW